MKINRNCYGCTQLIWLWYVFFIKGYHATAWGTKDLNLGKTNLTHINYGNIAAKLNLLTHLNIIKKVKVN